METAQSETPDTDSVLNGGPLPGKRPEVLDEGELIRATLCACPVDDPDWKLVRGELQAKLGVELPETPARTVALIGDGALVMPGEMTALVTLQREFDERVKAMEEFSTSNVSNRFFALRDQQAADVRAGKVVGMLPNRNDIARDSRQRNALIAEDLVRLMHEKLVPLAMPILDRFAQKAADFLRATEQRDRQECALTGLAYEPSLVWRAVAHLTLKYSSAKRLPRVAGIWLTPRHLLGHIIDL